MTNLSPIAPPLVLPSVSAWRSHAYADGACDGDLTNFPTIAARAQPNGTAQPSAVLTLRKGKVMAGIITSAAMIACLISTSACTPGDWGWPEGSADPTTYVDGVGASSAARDLPDGLAGASRPYTRN